MVLIQQYYYGNGNDALLEPHLCADNCILLPTVSLSSNETAKAGLYITHYINNKLKT